SKLTIKAYRRKRANRALCWWQYLSLNREMLRICKHIQVHSRYWSAFLTVMFPYYNILNCYLMYTALVVTDDSIAMGSLFLIIVCEIFVFFFALINECAKVVK